MENINDLKINSLSKSSYIKGLQCSKALWFSNFRKDLKLPVDEKAQSLFDTGNEVNDLARKCFAEGKKAADSYFDIEESSNFTKELIKRNLIRTFFVFGIYFYLQHRSFLIHFTNMQYWKLFS